MLHWSLEGVRKHYPEINFLIRWMPGHKGIEGNKKADEEAKKAITERSSNQNALPKALKKTLPHRKLAMKWAYHKKLKICAQKIWEDSPHYSLLKKTDPTAVLDKYLKLIANLLRKEFPNHYTFNNCNLIQIYCYICSEAGILFLEFPVPSVMLNSPWNVWPTQISKISISGPILMIGHIFRTSHGIPWHELFNGHTSTLKVSL